MSGQRGRYVPDPNTTEEWIRHARPINPPRYDPDQIPYKCYRINLDYIPALVALVDYYAWPDAFIGSDEERQLAADRFAELSAIFSEGNQDCGGDSMTEYRENPNLPCDYQYSNDGGITWQPFINLNKCTAAATILTVTANWHEGDFYIDESMTLYDGDITNIHPEYEYGDSHDPDRDAAICWAIDELIDIACAAKIKMIEDDEFNEDSQLGRAAAFLFALGELSNDMAAEGIYPQATALAGLALQFSSLVVGVIAWITKEDVSIYQDEDAKNELRCWMYDAMAGQTPTFAVWTDSADRVLDGNAEKIRQIVFPLVQGEEAYVAYLRVIADLLDVAIAGSLPNSCDDCDALWSCLIEDFRDVPNADFERIIDSHGHYDGAGHLIADGNGPGGSNRVVWSCQFNADFDIDTMIVYYTASNLSDHDSRATVTYNGIAYINLSNPAEGVNVDIHGGGSEDGRVLVVDFDTGLSDGDCEVLALYIAGKGDNPCD